MEHLPLLGGSFDPVHKDHRRAALVAVQKYNRVKIVPCGPRSDKCTVKRINPVHRAAMLQLGLGDIAGVEFDFSDLENDHFTTTWELEHYFRSQGFEPI